MERIVKLGLVMMLVLAGCSSKSNESFIPAENKKLDQNNSNKPSTLIDSSLSNQEQVTTDSSIVSSDNQPTEISQNSSSTENIKSHCKSLSENFCSGGNGKIVSSEKDDSGCLIYVCEKIKWKTYVNKKYGYEIKYPNDWYVYDSNLSDVFFQRDEEKEGSIPSQHASGLEIMAKSSDSNPSLLKLEKNKFSKAGVSFSEEVVLISNKKGKKLKSNCDGVGCGNPKWFVENGNYA